MKYNRYPKRDAVKHYFPLPNEIFCLDLSAGEIAVYAYLMYCESYGKKLNLPPTPLKRPLTTEVLLLSCISGIMIVSPMVKSQSSKVTKYEEKVRQSS